MRAEGPGVRPAKGNALVIGSPSKDNPLPLLMHPSAQRANNSYASPARTREVKRIYTFVHYTVSPGRIKGKNCAGEIDEGGGGGRPGTASGRMYVAGQGVKIVPHDFLARRRGSCFFRRR